MFSNDNLVTNEILSTLQQDPNLTVRTKETLGRLKQNTNKWRGDLTNVWGQVEYPPNCQASIYKLNAEMKNSANA